MSQTLHPVDHYVAELVRASLAGEAPDETSAEEDLFIQAHPQTSFLISQAVLNMDTKGVSLDTEDGQLGLLRRALFCFRRSAQPKESQLTAIKRLWEEISRSSIPLWMRFCVAIEAMDLAEDEALKKGQDSEVADAMVLEIQAAPKGVFDLWDAASMWSDRRRPLPQGLIQILNRYRLEVKTPADEALLAHALSSPTNPPSPDLESLHAHLLEHLDLLPLGHAENVLSAIANDMPLRERLLKRAVNEVESAPMVETSTLLDVPNLRLRAASQDRASILKIEYIKEYLMPSSPQAILDVLALIEHLPTSEDALRGSVLVCVLHAAGRMEDSAEGQNTLWQRLLKRSPDAPQKSYGEETPSDELSQGPEERSAAWQGLETSLLGIELPSIIVLEVMGLRWPDRAWGDKVQEYFITGLLAHEQTRQADFGREVATRPGLQHGLKMVSSEVLERRLGEVPLERCAEVLQGFVRYHGNIGITEDFRLHLTSSRDGNIRQLAILLPDLADGQNQPEEGFQPSAKRHKKGR